MLTDDGARSGWCDKPLIANHYSTMWVLGLGFGGLGPYDLGKCQFYSMGPSNKRRIFVCCSYIQVGNLGRVVLPRLCSSRTCLNQRHSIPSCEFQPTKMAKAFRTFGAIPYYGKMEPHQHSRAWRNNRLKLKTSRK